MQVGNAVVVVVVVASVHRLLDGPIELCQDGVGVLQRQKRRRRPVERSRRRVLIRNDVRRRRRAKSRRRVPVVRRGRRHRRVVASGAAAHLVLEPVDRPLPPIRVEQQLVLDRGRLVGGVDQDLDALVGPAAVRGLVVLDERQESVDLERRVAVDDELEPILLQGVRQDLEETRHDESFKTISA